MPPISNLKINNRFPSSLNSGLQVWHTLSDQAGSNGSTVTSVTDLSGNSRTRTPAGSQHTLKIESNGLKSLNSNGTNDQINFSGTGVTIQTVAFLLKQNSGLDRWNEYHGIVSYQSAVGANFTLVCDGVGIDNGRGGRDFTTVGLTQNETWVDNIIPDYSVNNSPSFIKQNGDFAMMREYHLVIVEYTSALSATTDLAWLQERAQSGRWFKGYFCDGWIWNRALTHTEKLGLYAWAVTNRGYKNVLDGSATKCIYFDGNSLTCGATVDDAGVVNAPLTVALSSLGSNYTGGVVGTGGATLSQLLNGFDNNIALRRKSQYSKNIYLCWEGENYLANGSGDGNAAFAVYSAICDKARAQGFTVVGTTVIDRQGFLSISQATFDSYRSTLNTLIRNYHSGLGENICDFAANANLSDATNTTYFYTDKIHLNATGYGVVAGILAANMP